MIAELIPAWTAEAIHLRMLKEILCGYHDQKFSGLATRSSSSLVKGFEFPIYQRARARGRFLSEEGIWLPNRTHLTNRGTLGARVMTLTLGGRSEGQALHTSSDVMGRYRFPRARLSRWLGPTKLIPQAQLGIQLTVFPRQVSNSRSCDYEVNE